MKLKNISTWTSLILLISAITTAEALEYTLKPGDVISIKSSSGKTTYRFNSNSNKTNFLYLGNNQKSIQKRINKCARWVSAHQNAGLSRHHPKQYSEIEKLLNISKKHQLSQYKKEAVSSISKAEKLLMTIENNYPQQSFSSIRNCFNLTRWEQCI
jgi:hypothetical protein